MLVSLDVQSSNSKISYRVFTRQTSDEDLERLTVLAVGCSLIRIGYDMAPDSERL